MTTHDAEPQGAIGCKRCNDTGVVGQSDMLRAYCDCVYGWRQWGADEGKWRRDYDTARLAAHDQSEPSEGE